MAGSQKGRWKWDNYGGRSMQHTQSTRGIKEPWQYYEEGREVQFSDWVNNSGYGLMNFNFGDVPDRCVDFCLEQYLRFRVPYSERIHEVIVAGASAAFHFVDYWNPYAMFRGVSDVNMTFDWSTHTYLIHGFDRGSSLKKEADPQQLETFAAVPGQAEAVFNEMIMKPGLKALPYSMGGEIAEILEGHNGEECWDSISTEADLALRELCRGDKRSMFAYFELAAWASFIWLVGPYGRWYRAERHEIMGTAMQHGECILLEGTIISPEYYTKVARPPKSCHRCGIQTWCVEPSMTGRDTLYICEACLNFDMPKFGFANCGAKYCKDSTCPNHPFAHMGQAGMYETARHGQLAQMARNKAGGVLYSGVDTLSLLRS